jgi:hypothetical protein
MSMARLWQHQGKHADLDGIRWLLYSCGVYGQDLDPTKATSLPS